LIFEIFALLEGQCLWPETRQEEQPVIKGIFHIAQPPAVLCAINSPLLLKVELLDQ